MLIEKFRPCKHVYPTTPLVYAEALLACAVGNFEASNVPSPQSHPKIKVFNFSSLNDPTFTEYLVSSGTYFIMCHDGARAPNNFEIEYSAEEASYWNRQKSTFRWMIWQFMSLGFNVALANGLEIRDTKV